MGKINKVLYAVCIFCTSFTLLRCFPLFYRDKKGLRKGAVGRKIQPIPFFSRQVNIRAFAHLAHMRGRRRACDHLFERRMAQNPSGCNGGGLAIIFFRQTIERIIQFRELSIPHENAVKETILQRRPSLHRYIVQTAIFHSIPCSCKRRIRIHIHVKPCIEHRRMH